MIKQDHFPLIEDSCQQYVSTFKIFCFWFYLLFESFFTFSILIKIALHCLQLWLYGLYPGQLSWVGGPGQRHVAVCTRLLLSQGQQPAQPYRWFGRYEKIWWLFFFLHWNIYCVELGDFWGFFLALILSWFLHCYYRL